MSEQYLFEWKNFLTEGINPQAPVKVGQFIIDPTWDGLGTVGWNLNVNYKGFAVWMKPIDFLNLNPKREIDSEYYKKLKQVMIDKKHIGPPWLQVVWNGKDWEVKQHEGRGRMMVFHELQPDEEVMVHMFPSAADSEMRARHIKPEMTLAYIEPDHRANGGSAFKPSRAILNQKEVS